MTNVIHSVRLNIDVAVICFVIAASITYLAWLKGYFQLKNPPEHNQSISWKTSLRAFGLYLGVQVIVAPIFYILWHLAQGEAIGSPQSFHDTPIQKGWWSMFSVVLTGIALVGYLFTLEKNEKTAILGKRFYDTPIHDFSMGVLTWFIAFPWVVVMSKFFAIILELLNLEPTADQLAVKHLKDSFVNPLLLTVTSIFIITLIPFLEELLFRGFLQTSLKDFFGLKRAIVMTALIFALFHYAGSQGTENIELITSLFVLACFLGFIRERQQSLMASFGLHSAFNAFSVLMIYGSME